MRWVIGEAKRSLAAHLLHIDVGVYLARLQPGEGHLRSIRRKRREEFHPRIACQWNRSRDGWAAIPESRGTPNESAQGA